MEAKNVVWIAVATWLCWSPVFLLGYDYLRIEFSTKDATQESYRNFIKTLRDILTNSSVYGIPMARSSAPNEERFILVDLTNDAGTVTLAIDVVSLYLVGYQVGGIFYMFPDQLDPADSCLFPELPHKNIQFGSSYGELEKAAGALRPSISLGLPVLNQAITDLCHYDVKYRQKARYLIGFIEMISEAVRFKQVESQMRLSMGSGLFPDTFTPNDATLFFENNWDRISTDVTNSIEGFLRNAIPIPSWKGIRLVDNAALLINLVGLLKFCSRTPRPTPPPLRFYYSSFIIMNNISVVSNEDSCGNYDDDEPRARIMGPNGLCAQVQPGRITEEGRYSNGAPIQLLPCDPSGKSEEQLWTLKRDGTFRSRGMCMAAYAQSPGDYVMIYICDSVSKDSGIWEVSEDGTIINYVSSLALTAVPPQSDDPYTLTVQPNILDFHQAWLATNVLEPFHESIVGNYGEMDL